MSGPRNGGQSGEPRRTARVRMAHGAGRLQEGDEAGEVV
ncbi:hypothetical protein P3T25_005723 [Paraburkholderia sp. GAS32]